METVHSFEKFLGNVKSVGKDGACLIDFVVIIVILFGQIIYSLRKIIDFIDDVTEGTLQS